MFHKDMYFVSVCDSSKEFWCKSGHENMCISKQSRCNVAVDCYDNDDENGCAGKSQDTACTDKADV